METPNARSRAALTLADSSYVEWPAIFAGAVIAMAVSFILATFGVAVGLSALSPWTSTGRTVAAVSVGAAFWIILVHLWSFALGGYLSGRMRHRHGDGVPAEVEFRDGAHGALAWAFAVTTGVIVAALVAGSIAKGALDLGAAAANDPTSIASETLLRTTNVSAAEPSTALRADVTRLLARSTTSKDGLVAADRTYLAQVVAARAGIPQAEAQQRVDAALVELKKATDKARKTGVVAGFLTAATLLLGAAAAWWGGTVGGRHRDLGTIWHGLGGRMPLSEMRSSMRKP